ncbi:hypothetical protein CHS0354_039842 [Potamilus streckersoni]|uniref:Cadherin domain-containing protein n=1 Tax=Potamilus streckersoni TaxID=2493646 RepID=A0AAE0W0Q6_9BIVA|nr:hypothetical protein CHS0354_039842 [Potamilus streckersoni]
MTVKFSRTIIIQFLFFQRKTTTQRQSHIPSCRGLITAVTTNDADDDSNSVLSYSIYSIIDNNVTDIFTMETETGIIILKRKLTSSDTDLFTFRIKVKDHRKFRLSSSAYLTKAFSQALESHGGVEAK